MQRRHFLRTALLVPAAGALRAQEAASRPRVLAVSAHPADFCSRAAGTLIKHVRAGSAVKVVWLTHGETDESQLLYKKRPGISIEEVRRIREQEAFAAVHVVGAEGRMFGFGDNPLRMPPERMQMLAQEIAAFKPNIILTHWKEELSYPTHWLTSRSVIEAAQMAGGSWDIRFFEPTIGTATRYGFVPDHYVDITEVFDQKMEALKKLETQPHLLEYYSTLNRMRGLESGRRYAEAFVRWAPRPPVVDLLAR
ncbi:MAG: PIG-L family deacetylase [Bryobacterales bacterium]|nr:PIG-L family deacetylase [Bryobacterales bacterium]